MSNPILPPAPSSSPIPLDDRLEVPGAEGDEIVDGEEVEVFVDEVEEEDVDEDDDDEDLDEDDEEEEEEEEDEEYDHEDGCQEELTEPCERTPGPCAGGPTLPPNHSPTYNSPTFLGSSSDEEDDDEGEVDESLERDESDEEEEDDEDGMEPSGFLLPADGDASSIQGIPPDAQARLEAFFEAAGTGFTDGKLMSDPENLRKLTLTVSSALGEASAAINRMRDSQRKSIEEGRNDSMEEGDSLLALACSSGYFELARVLLAMGANVDDRGSKGDLTPLMDAASQGHLEIVKLLISHGADVNAQSACGNSPLMYACSAGHEDIVRELLKAGARVEDNNENGHTPLMEAASSGHVSVAKILLDHGAGINTHSNEFKESALTVACYKGHLEMVRFLLEAGADQQHKTDEMHTALMEASMDGHVEVARLLLDSGAQVNMPADSFESPLTLAACGGHVELAELLIERGANIEEVNDEGYTPLMEAAREGHLAVVKCLLKNTATINAETEETHETALTLAACGGFLDVVDTLCHHGADIEIGASTPVMEAAQEGHYQVVKYLLDRNADITRETQNKDTALTFACENGHVDVVELLIEKGDDYEHLADGGRTPLMKACRGGHGDVIKLLISKGADVNRQSDTNDHTPLSLACAGGHIAAVEVLLAAGANPYHKLKDNSTMIIEAARGGHTSVIRALLDHAPNRGPEKGGQPGHAKQHPKGSTSNQSGHTQQRAQAVELSKTGANQGKLLRKSRSTSTLDSSVQKGNTASASGEGKSKPLPPMTSIPANSPLLKNLTLSLGDGKPQVASSEEVRKKPVPVPTPVAIVDKNSNVGNRKTATPSSSAVPSNVCTECNAKTSAEQPHGHVHVKRSAETLPVLPGGNTSAVSGPSTSSSSSTCGPPLVPSQVTAATAISERPKAKANKPSARKQIQLQQQIQQTLAIQQLLHSGGVSPTGSDKTVQLHHGSPSTGVSPVSSAGTSPGGSNAGLLASTPDNTRLTPAAAAAGNPNPSFIPAPTLLQMQVQQVRGGGKCEFALSETHFTLDAKQLMQIFTQHHQSQLIYKGDRKYECFDGGLPLDSGEAVEFSQVVASGTLSGQYPPGASVGHQLPTSPGGPGSGVSSAGTTTTTTTTTVVVTHGNGDTETIIEGDNLPPGTNEMIMTAAAAAFPIDCYSMPGGALSGSGSSSGGQVQVQSYQLSSPAGLSVGMGVSGDLTSGMSPLTTTTMHTTTIINSGSGNFQPQILLPHPPPLPAAISAAAAAAGLIPPSGAPPEGPIRQVQPQANHQVKSGPAGKVVQRGTTPTTLKDKGTYPVKGPVPTTTTQGAQATTLSTPTAVPVQKKQTAKRTRPFSQGPNGQVSHGACSNNQKGGHSVASTQTPLSGNDKAPKALDVDSATESNGETSLSIAAGQGHYEVVEFLLTRKAHIEHRDKKGCTPLILAADGGHEKVVELLLNHGSEIEAQSERTKDTALSLACTKGRYEVVELLLKRGANKEHRNVSDYTPLSLAASGGFVNIIKLLLQYGAEINSRTGSKLGISPLMLAAMNGNTAAVKLLLDMGSDINAQIETNKNTALTLACFQGRHEVVQLLLDRKANLEHRAKTGLTPLMEAANGGYVEVGKVLIEKGADVNALPVPATRDTALTIAADKGHNRFVEMLILSQANTDVRNKKGCTPLWLACNGGHLDVAQALQKARADIDAQDNRRISCLMASFKRGHVKIVRWIVKHVKQFPNDQEMSRYFLSITSEVELLKRAQQCMEYIKQAKDKQAVEASKNANILLEELELERSREESKRLAAAKRREKKKKKKQEKKHQYSPSADNDDDRDDENDEDEDDNDDNNEDVGMIEFMDSGIEVNCLNTNSSSADHKKKGQQSNSNIIKGKSNKENLQQAALKPPTKQAVNNSRKNIVEVPLLPSDREVPVPEPTKEVNVKSRKKKSRGSKGTGNVEPVVEPVPAPAEVHLKQAPKANEKENVSSKGKISTKSEKEILKEKIKEVEEISVGKVKKEKKGRETSEDKKNLKEAECHKDLTQHQQSGKGSNLLAHGGAPINKKGKVDPLAQGPEPLMGISLNPSQLRKAPFEHERESHVSHTFTAPSGKPVNSQVSGTASAKTGPGRKDDGWKEVTRSCPSSRSKKVIVPSSVISRVIGRGGCNINAIREATGAHIEVEKQQKGQVQPERTIQIKGSADATKQAYNLISALMTEPDVDIKKLIPQQRVGASSSASSGGASSSTPTPILCTNAFPIIGSASTPLPPIGQPMAVATSGPPIQSTQQLNVSTTSAPIEISKGFSTGKSTNMKGSPTSKTGLSSSVSPPLTSAKGGSPPIKKPTVVSSVSASHVSTNNSNFEIGNFSLSEVNSEAYNKSYPLGMIGKRSMVFTPSASAVSSNTSSTSTTTSSFASKLNQMSHHNAPITHEKQSWDNKQRNPTPTSSRVKTPTSFGATVNSTESLTPPPVIASENMTTNNISNKNHSQQSHRTSSHTVHSQNLGERQPIPSTLPTFGSNIGHLHNANVSSTGTERASKESEVVSQQLNGPSGGVDPSNFGGSVVIRNLAPGTNPNAAIGSNRSNACERSSSEASNQDQQQPPPLEYSPFNYTFSKTTGWFPGDLAVRESTNPNGVNSQQFGTSNLITSIATGGSTSALSASRAMNFASVAASGISSSMSTTTAQMSQAAIGQGVQNGNNMVSGMITMGKSTSLTEGHQESEVPKADASKAPGYRGSTTMGSPILRLQQTQQPTASNLPNSNYNMDGPLSSHFASAAGLNPGGLNHNNMMNYNQARQNYGPSGQPGVANQYSSQDMAANMMNAHQQSMNGGNPMLYSGNRLNPRAPSFMAKVQPGQQQQLPPPNHSLQGSQQSANSAFASTQQSQYNNMQYKNMSGSGPNSQYGGRSGMGVPVRSAAGVGSGWTGYGGNIGNGGVDDLTVFQGLAALGGPAMMDPSALLSGMDLHDNQNAMKLEDRRLPRPIGGERTWKGGNGGSIGNMTSFSILDCMDAGPLPQPISLPSTNHGNGNPPQGSSWLAMHGHGGSSQPTGFPSSTQQQLYGGLSAHGPPQPQPGAGPRAGDRSINRRFIEDMDPNIPNRMHEFQQIYDGQQRMMNGGNIPPMMHMPNAPPHLNPAMYPFGLEHLEQQSVPKLDQQWESHPIMDDKHMQGGWGGTKWGN